MMQNLLFVHPDHLCFERTTYDNKDGIMFVTVDPVRPFMYLDQIITHFMTDQYSINCYFEHVCECACCVCATGFVKMCSVRTISYI